MIIEFLWIDVIGWFATILSLAGNWYVANVDLKVQTRGYGIWFVSNAIWMSYFLYMKQWSPFILFTAYFLITIVALMRRLPDDWMCSDEYEMDVF